MSLKLILAAVLLRCLLGVHAASSGMRCPPPPSQYAHYCEASDTLQQQNNLTYSFYVNEDEMDSMAFDIYVNLSSSIGDADLTVIPPEGSGQPWLSSSRGSGSDVVVVYRSELWVGTYTLVVSGYTATSTFNLVLVATPQRRVLNSREAAAVGQMLINCCQEEEQCLALKEAHPMELIDQDNTTNPNYCEMRPNICTLGGNLLWGGFPEQGLVCPFPTKQVLQLSQLQRFDLSGNSISGDIAAIATALQPATGHLRHLMLPNNQLAGDFSQACGLAGMRALRLDNNALVGSIPACLMSSTTLREVYLAHNKLQGTVPPLAAQGSRLVALIAGHQEATGGLSGALPELQGAQMLVAVDLSGSSITGPLPDLPASLTQLASLRLGSNRIAGTLPASWGKLPNIQEIDLEQNQLTGTLNASLAANPSLQVLDLAGNQMSGSLPANWYQAESLFELDLSSNAFSGTVPSSLAALRRLVELNLAANQLTGDLQGFAFMSLDDRDDLNSQMRSLNLSRNRLTGDPADLHYLQRLGVFQISEDSPSQTQTDMPGLARVFDLSYNLFAGTFPTWLVQSLVAAIEPVAASLMGNNLTCPASTIHLQKDFSGRLSGLTCYEATSVSTLSASTMQRNLSDYVSMSDEEHHHLGVGGRWAIILILVAAVCAGGAGYYWYYRNYIKPRRYTMADNGLGSLAGGIGSLSSRPASFSTHPKLSQTGAAGGGTGWGDVQLGSPRAPQELSSKPQRF